MQCVAGAPEKHRDAVGLGMRSANLCQQNEMSEPLMLTARPSAAGEARQQQGLVSQHRPHRRRTGL